MFAATSAMERLASSTYGVRSTNWGAPATADGSAPPEEVLALVLSDVFAPPASPLPEAFAGGVTSPEDAFPADSFPAAPSDGAAPELKFYQAATKLYPFYDSVTQLVH